MTPYQKLQPISDLCVLFAGCMEAGYADFGQIRTDPDLAVLRSDERFEVRLCCENDARNCISVVVSILCQAVIQVCRVSVQHGPSTKAYLYF